MSLSGRRGHFNFRNARLDLGRGAHGHPFLLLRRRRRWSRSFIVTLTATASAQLFPFSGGFWMLLVAEVLLATSSRLVPPTSMTGKRIVTLEYFN